MFDTDGNLGMVPIECTYGSPNCAGDLVFAWGSPFTLPANTVPPDFYGTSLGSTPAIIPINAAAGVITPATPAAPATQQATTPEQLIAGIDNKTLVLAAGGIIAALVILSD